MEKSNAKGLADIYRALVFEHGLTLIPLQAGKKVPAIKRWQEGNGFNKFNWPEKGINAERQYAVCPHLAGLSVVDIDTAPPYTDKTTFRLECDAHAAQELISEHIQGMYGSADIIEKIVCMHPSGSGKGFHIWFRRDMSEIEMHGGLGRPKGTPGEIFDGVGYVVLYDPELLLQALTYAEHNHGPENEITVGDLTDILIYWDNATRTECDEAEERAVKVASEGRRARLVDAMTVGQLVSALGNGPAADFTHDIMDLAGDAYYDRMTLPNSEYHWTPAALAQTFSRFPAHYWDDYWFWLWSGMALHDLAGGHGGPYGPLALQIWSEMSKISSCFDAEHQARTWMCLEENIGSDKGRRTMGTMIQILKELGLSRPRVDFSSVTYFMEHRLEMTGDPADFITTADLYKAYVVFTRDEKHRRARKAFTAYVGANGLTKSKRAKGRGFQGVKLK